MGFLDVPKSMENTPINLYLYIGVLLYWIRHLCISKLDNHSVGLETHSTGCAGLKSLFSLLGIPK